jgi:hypothetical protein
LPARLASLGQGRPALVRSIRDTGTRDWATDEAHLVRHDIVHRGGKTKEGKTVEVGTQDLNALRADVTAFVNAIESKLEERFRLDRSGLTGDNEF